MILKLHASFDGIANNYICIIIGIVNYNNDRLYVNYGCDGNLGGYVIYADLRIYKLVNISVIVK